MARADLIDWLLDSDAALRWQVERDLLGAPEEVWTTTRARLATRVHPLVLPLDAAIRRASPLVTRDTRHVGEIPGLELVAY